MTAIRSAASRAAAVYRATREPEFVDVPDQPYIMVDGRGDPALGQEYASAVRDLYSLAYGVKFAVRDALGMSVKVGPLESLWWSGDLRDFATGNRDAWRWTAMIRQPSDAPLDLVVGALGSTGAAKGIATDRCRCEILAEGRVAQVLHVGPYSTEGPTIRMLHEFIAAAGLTFDGRVHRHHEIYLSDPRRTAPDRLRTIIRQPVAPV
jgi:hypothetical protein